MVCSLRASYGVAVTPNGESLVVGTNGGTLDLGAMPLVSTGMSAFVAELAK